MRLALIINPVQNLRSVLLERRASFHLAVKKPQRIFYKPSLAVGAKKPSFCFIIRDKLFFILPSACFAPDTVYLDSKSVAFKSYFLANIKGNQNKLGVNNRPAAAKHFKSELMELPISSRLRIFPPKHRLFIIELHGLGH